MKEIEELIEKGLVSVFDSIHENTKNGIENFDEDNFTVSVTNSCNKFKAEILAKFAELEKTKEETIEFVCEHNRAIEMFNQRIAKLEKENEDLKCCGNCRNRCLKSCINYDIKSNSWPIASFYCNNWQSDNMKRSER